RARALRSSGRVGQRFETLKVIRKAAKIKVTPELRDEAVAALFLPDVELAREWEGFPEDAFAVAADATFQRFVRMDKHGALTVFRLTALARFAPPAAGGGGAPPPADPRPATVHGAVDQSGRPLCCLRT